jgi:hypothetical protein
VLNENHFFEEGASPNEFFLEVDTFEDVRGRGEPVAQLAEAVRITILEPAMSSSIAAHRRGEWTMAPPGRTSSRQYVYNEGNWALLLERLREDRVGQFVFIPEGEHLRGIKQDLLVVEFVLAAPNAWVADRAFSFSVRSTFDYFDGELSLAVQHAWAGLARRIARTVGAATGYLMVGRRFDEARSPYENSLELSDGRVHAREYARGAYWGNILGAEQIRRLGGLERVLAEAPCALAEDLSGESGELVYLQLTEDVREVGPEHLQALHEFMRPVLREAES